jgi:hypothetical protein
MATPEEAANRLLESAERDRVVGLAGWGAFFAWLGLAWFAELGWGWTLVGLGLALLAEAVARLILGLRLSMSGVFFGVLFLGGGFWHMSQAPWMVVPGLFLAFGAVMLLRALMGTRRP